jgi:hypothetical protein
VHQNTPSTSVSLKYRNHFGCSAGYRVRVSPTKNCERFKSSLLHSVTQGSSPSLHNEGAVLWSWTHVSSTLGKRCTHSPSWCPTKAQEIHKSPCFHISRRRSKVVHLDITTKVRTRRVWVYKDKLDLWYKSTWLRNGVAIIMNIQLGKVLAVVKNS